eukprot:g20459.t1
MARRLLSRGFRPKANAEEVDQDAVCLIEDKGCQGCLATRTMKWMWLKHQTLEPGEKKKLEIGDFMDDLMEGFAELYRLAVNGGQTCGECVRKTTYPIKERAEVVLNSATAVVFVLDVADCTNP